MKFRISFLLFPLVFLYIFLVSCRKDSASSRVPYVYVNIQLYPNSIDFIPTSGWVYVTGGNRGIIVYRMTENEFFAYDRTCPYDPENLAARVRIDPSGVIVVDTVCGSKYILTTGYPISGPSKSPLLQYRTSYDGEVLYISN
ncbi:MAG TPA: hypothetical protein VF298_07415 [Bacteroidales bacterium]|jgi:nitrite reductase/ring-hydroxylating ferredoxin subunit